MNVCKNNGLKLFMGIVRTLIFVNMICVLPAFAQNTKKGAEPPSAEEVAKKKAADKAKNDKFQMWKNTLSQEQQFGRLCLRKIWGISIFLFIKQRS